MQVQRARTAGFCMGVSLALNKLDRAILGNASEQVPPRRICTFGPIIHNPQVLADYEAKGVACLNSPDEARKEDIVVIRAHGIPREEEASIRACGAKIIDATCPRVKKAQLAIEKATREGASLLLFGDADHPEVRGLISYAHGPSLVFASPEELSQLNPDPKNAWVLASQTTQDASVFARIRKRLSAKLTSLQVLSTICDATGERQAEARAIAQNVEAMVVIGGRQSGNTRRLAALAAECGVATHHVEKVEELTRKDFEKLSSVGLTAGASTPKTLIDEAEAWLKTL